MTISAGNTRAIGSQVSDIEGSKIAGPRPDDERSEVGNVVLRSFLEQGASILFPAASVACMSCARSEASASEDENVGGGVANSGEKICGVFSPGEATGVLLSPLAALGFTLGVGKTSQWVGKWLEGCLEQCTWSPQRVSPNRLAMAWASLLALLPFSPWLPGRCLLI